MDEQRVFIIFVIIIQTTLGFNYTSRCALRIRAPSLVPSLRIYNLDTQSRMPHIGTDEGENVVELTEYCPFSDETMR